MSLELRKDVNKFHDFYYISNCLQFISTDSLQSDDKNILNDELPVNFVISGLRRINCETRSLAVPRGADYAITSFKSSPWGGPPMEGS